MKITVRVFATLRRKHPREQVLEFNGMIKASDVVNSMKLSSEEVSIIMINGKRIQSDQILEDQDTISLFPPVGGG